MPNGHSSQRSSLRLPVSPFPQTGRESLREEPISPTPGRLPPPPQRLRIVYRYIRTHSPHPPPSPRPWLLSFNLQYQSDASATKRAVRSNESSESSETGLGGDGARLLGPIDPLRRVLDVGIGEGVLVLESGAGAQGLAWVPMSVERQPLQVSYRHQVGK
jgi:hypothetical protein